MTEHPEVLYREQGKETVKSPSPCDNSQLRMGGDEGCGHALHGTHSGTTRTRLGADFKAFHKLHKDSSAQGRYLTGTKGLKITVYQTVTEK